MSIKRKRENTPMKPEDVKIIESAFKLIINTLNPSSVDIRKELKSFSHETLSNIFDIINHTGNKPYRLHSIIPLMIPTISNIDITVKKLNEAKDYIIKNTLFDLNIGFPSPKRNDIVNMPKLSLFIESFCV